MLATSRVGWYSLAAFDPCLFGTLAMIYLNVILTVKDASDVPEIQSLLSEQGRLSRAEPGCLRFEVYHSQNDPKVFILNEHWADQTAVDAHRKAIAYTTIYQPKVLPRVDRTPHPSELVP
jgi:quinol monooxygenase YgiN